MWYTILFFTVLGLVISKEFRAGIGTVIGAALVFTPLIALGTPYALLFHAPYIAIKNKDWRALTFYWGRFIDGVYASLGDMMKFGFSYRYDELGNVTGGELLEDLIGSEEGTPLGDKQVTVSASIGYYEYKKLYMNKFGTGLSKALNTVFRQTMHAIGSWRKKLALDELKEQNLHGNK